MRIVEACMIPSPLNTRKPRFASVQFRQSVKRFGSLRYVLFSASVCLFILFLLVWFVIYCVSPMSIHSKSPQTRTPCFGRSPSLLSRTTGQGFRGPSSKFRILGTPKSLLQQALKPALFPLPKPSKLGVPLRGIVTVYWGYMGVI